MAGWKLISSWTGSIKHFLPNTHDVSDKTRVLIFDGHFSHLSLGLVELAKLERAVFRPIKMKWQELLRKRARTQSGPDGKKDFSLMLNTLVQEAFNPDTLKPGFRVCGICPFNGR